MQEKGYESCRNMDMRDTWLWRFNYVRKKRRFYDTGDRRIRDFCGAPASGSWFALGTKLCAWGIVKEDDKLKGLLTEYGTAITAVLGNMGFVLIMQWFFFGKEGLFGALLQALARGC